MIRRAPVTARRPYAELAREAEKARLLLDAARQLGETLEPERVYTRFCELLADVVEHDGVSGSSYEDTDGLIRCDYAWSDGEQLDASRLPPLPLNREGGGMQSRVIVTGEAAVFNDVPDVVQHEPGVYYDVDRKGTMRKIPDTGPPKTRAAMMVPVKHEGAVVGVVQLMSDRALADALASWSELVDRIPVAEGRSSPRSVTLPVAVPGGELWLSFVAVRGSAGVVYAFRDLTSERRLEEEKTDLVATISHELRTPMAAVYGAAETLLHRDDLAPEQRRELLAMIGAQATRLTGIVESVLLTSRLDRGDVEVDREPVDVMEVARATVEAMRSRLPPAISLELEDGHDSVDAAGDADRIQQVLVNLLDNAIKYGGGSPVTVRVDRVDGVVRLSVRDLGPGLSAAEQARIFDKFYRAGPQLTRAGGTGLGLYISRELVRRMGGRLDVQSEVGAGATFVLELPRA